MTASIGRRIAVAVIVAASCLGSAAAVYAVEASHVSHPDPDPVGTESLSPLPQCSADLMRLARDTAAFSADFQTTVGTVLHAGDGILGTLSQDIAVISGDMDFVKSTVVSQSASQFATDLVYVQFHDGELPQSWNADQDALVSQVNALTDQCQP